MSNQNSNIDCLRVNILTIKNAKKINVSIGLTAVIFQIVKSDRCQKYHSIFCFLRCLATLLGIVLLW